ncbi:TetR family transcriptional regulator [Streptomyces sp. NPDC000410]|uniref:TetR family transcriptional regulator n=1 Tax=Streptomyces sp. NPDC000410 TaxID=3154254 RepID=UPI0033269A46
MVKQDRARRTHALVLDAAAAEFAAHGFAATNLQLVAARTGLTKGALYGHFASKAELAAELTRQFEEHWRHLLDAAATGAGSPLRALHTLVTELTRRTQQDVRFTAGLRLVCEEAQSQGAAAVQLEALRELLLRLVVRAQQDGEIAADHAPAVLSQLLLTLVYGLPHTPSAGEDARPPGEMWQILLPAMRRSTA